MYSIIILTNRFWKEFVHAEIAIICEMKFSFKSSMFSENICLLNVPIKSTFNENTFLIFSTITKHSLYLRNDRNTANDIGRIFQRFPGSLKLNILSHCVLPIFFKSIIYLIFRQLKMAKITSVKRQNGHRSQFDRDRINRVFKFSQEISSQKCHIFPTQKWVKKLS